MKLTISNSFIIISAIITFISFKNIELLSFWMNGYFFALWDYMKLVLQFIFYSFLHWSIFHLLFNWVFLYYFWNQVEIILWFKKYLIFFVLATVFNWVSILIFTSWNTIWISGFCMALLSFYTLKLFEIKNPEFKWWITAIIINVAIWLTPWISLVWHLFWAIFGWIFYYFDKLLKK